MESFSVNDNLTEENSRKFPKNCHLIERKNPTKIFFMKINFPGGIYLLKVNNKNTRTRNDV